MRCLIYSGGCNVAGIAILYCAIWVGGICLVKWLLAAQRVIGIVAGGADVVESGGTQCRVSIMANRTSIAIGVVMWEYDRRGRYRHQ